MSTTPPLLLIRTNTGWYPIKSAGNKPLAEEAKEYGEADPTSTQVEDFDGVVLWCRE